MVAHGASCSRSLTRRILPLPGEPWVHAEWRRCRVGLDYHVEIERHYHSVSYRFARQEVEARICARTVEIFLGASVSRRICAGGSNGRHTTISANMPSSHQRSGEWTTAKIRNEATRIGLMLRLWSTESDRPTSEVRIITTKGRQC
ncbi:Mu transposase domain-containing protein [Bradyrhizobium shewense]|uniref:Mu transposase domain-containing protein n=1 Tax=Bradyrhizobium shewense TaxID=1761772 RepID=UPI003D31B0D7